MGGRHRRGPRAPGRGRARPGGAARLERTERSPPRLTAAPGAGGPGPPAPPTRRARPGRAAPREGRAPGWLRGGGGEGAAAVVSLGPGIRRDLLPGGSNTRPAARAEPGHLPAGGLPSRPGAGRGAPPRRKCARPGPAAGRAAVPAPARPPRPAPAGGGPGGGGEAEAGIRRARAGRPQARRVESSGRTARAPPVYLLTVSRPLELSLQSSFQLSLTVLVGYRSRARI